MNVAVLQFIMIFTVEIYPRAFAVSKVCKDINRECLNTAQTKIVSEGCSWQWSDKCHFHEHFGSEKVIIKEPPSPSFSSHLNNV